MRQIVQTFGSGSADKTPFETNYIPKNLVNARVIEERKTLSDPVALAYDLHDSVQGRVSV
jgi:hypothetical protein